MRGAGDRNRSAVHDVIGQDSRFDPGKLHTGVRMHRQDDAWWNVVPHELKHLPVGGFGRAFHQHVPHGDDRGRHCRAVFPDSELRYADQHRSGNREADQALSPGANGCALHRLCSSNEDEFSPTA